MAKFVQNLSSALFLNGASSGVGEIPYVRAVEGRIWGIEPAPFLRAQCPECEMLPAYLRLRSLRVLHSRSGTVQFFKREGRTMLDGIFPHRFPFVMQPAYLHFFSELFQFIGYLVDQYVVAFGFCRFAEE